MRPRAVLFDFNGTLSDDEPILYEIYADLLAGEGRPLTLPDYLEHLAGLSEEALFAAWLGADHPRIDALVRERVARYRERVRDGGTIAAPVREAVRHAAAHVPVGVVSGARRTEIEAVVRAAGLAEEIAFVVPADDVAAGKPDPEGYERALALLGDVEPAEVLAFEDTEVGVASAKAAGLHVLAVTRTLGAERLAAADGLVERIEPELLRRLIR